MLREGCWREWGPGLPGGDRSGGGLLARSDSGGEDWYGAKFMAMMVGEEVMLWNGECYDGALQLKHET